MATKQYKYISFNNLSKFLDNIKNIFATKTEVNAKSDKNHTHNISDISNLQTTLDNKASTSHGTHVTHSTTTPLMDGTASAGTASTVARSDHRHPTDSSRAAQTSLDSHTGNTTTHITSAERTNWNSAHTHSQSSHAPSNAEKNQNAFSHVKVGDVSVSADTATDTLTIAGSNVTITPDATNDKITISVASGSTSTKGIVQLTNSTSSTSTTTAATPNSVKTAYDLANNANTAAKNAQTTADSKANASHTHTVSNISDLTVTATELNYMDGVTSGVQAQLDGKAASGHTHSYAASSSAGGAATSANKLNTNDGSATQPVYFANGVPVATTYTLGKSVPSNAVFTDSHYASKNVVGKTNATSNTTTALTNGNVYLNSVENGAVTSSHKISGSGATTVTTDANGNIVISSTDNNTTYNAAGSDLGLVKSGGDVTISSGVITVNDDSHNHTIANIDNLQSSLDAKAASSHNHSATNITSGTLSSDRLPTVPISKGGTGATTATAALTNFGITATADELNKLDGVTATTTELNYVDGVTSNIQTQLNGKAASSHTHNILSVQSDNYKQGTDLPSTYPRGETIFFSNNPTNKFNNTNYCTIHTIKGYGNMVCIQWLYPYNTNNDTIYYRTATYNSDTWRDWKEISISEHTHSIATTSENGLMSSSDKSKLDGIASGANKYSHPSYTARTGVPTANATLSHGGTFTVTQPVCDATGHITALNTRTYTLPSDNNTDTKVTNTLATTTKAYVTGTTSANTNTGTQVFDTGVYLDTTAGQLTATIFNGATFKGSGVATLAEVKTYLGI